MECENMVGWGDIGRSQEVLFVGPYEVAAEPSNWRGFSFLPFLIFIYSTFEIEQREMSSVSKMAEMDPAEIYTASDTMDSAAIFHTINDVVAFVLYMHQQIPS
jgi:hypothetical protein